MSQANQVRTYDPIASVVFLKTNERFGGLSNMAPGFPLYVNGIQIRTSEALYQACRFPHIPDIQRRIISERSPITAKRSIRPFLKESRPDWDAVRVKIMRWCLRVKLAQNWINFGELLQATGDRPIVEQSAKDDFWGAKVTKDGTLVGMNVLGRLLMELREQLRAKNSENLRVVEPLSIEYFLLFQRPIKRVFVDSEIEKILAVGNCHSSSNDRSAQCEVTQSTLFDQPAITHDPTDVRGNRVGEVRVHGDIEPYPKYKNSGQPFLGKIPAHWNVYRNGRLFSQRNETGFGELPILEVSLKTGVRVRDMDNLKRKQVMSDREKYKRAAQGDIAYNMMRMWQGAVGVAPVDGLVSPAYVVVRPFPEVDCRYFSYLFRTASYMNEVDAYSRGIVKDRNRLYWQDFKRMPSPVPSIDEQRHITRFLDAVGSKAQRFIRNKRRFIELLKEQKQNVINQAVTRGIDPNVKLKPSGVEWIGDIPEHWISRKFKHCAKFFSGGTPSKGNEGYWRGDIPWVSPKDMKTDRIYDAEDHITEEAVNSSATSIIDVGSLLLVVRSGILRRTIPIALVQRRVAFNQDIKAILPNRKLILPEYLHATIIGCEKRLLEIWSKVGATVESLEYEYFANSYLPLPPIEEQQAILDHIQEKSVEIDQAITRAQREIELMREYRTRLISDVVTGQVDVRGIDVPEVAEDELLVLDEDTGESDEVMDVELEAEVEQ